VPPYTIPDRFFRLPFFLALRLRSHPVNVPIQWSKARIGIRQVRFVPSIPPAHRIFNRHEMAIDFPAEEL